MMERRVKTLSRGLAEAVRSGSTTVVQFIHQSVKDFFVKKGLSTLHRSLKSPKTQTSEADFVVGIAHYQLSSTCIRYLAMEEIEENAQSTSHDIASLTFAFPFLDYATKSWVVHAKESETGSGSVPQGDLLDYFNWPSEALMQD